MKGQESQVRLGLKARMQGQSTGLEGQGAGPEPGARLATILSQRSASGVKSGAGSQLATGVKSLWSGPYSGQTAGSGSEAWVRSQTSRPYPGPECRVRVRVRESRTGAWSTVRAIPRARVQGHDQGLGHSNSEGSGVRSQSQDHTQLIQTKASATLRYPTNGLVLGLVFGLGLGLRVRYNVSKRTLPPPQ